MLEADGLKVGRDFFSAFRRSASIPAIPVPDQEHPESRRRHHAACTELGALFYGRSLDTVVPVGSTRVAEMVKLLENTFRMINIGLVNEIA